MKKEKIETESLFTAKNIVIGAAIIAAISLSPPAFLFALAPVAIKTTKFSTPSIEEIEKDLLTFEEN